MRSHTFTWISLLTILIIAVGLLALYSASHQNIRVTQKVFFDQLWMAGFGLTLMFAVSRIDCRRFYDIAYIFYGMSLILLLWVLLAGHHALGATRWISLGIINFQPSEISKLAVIWMLARYFSHRRPSLSFTFSSSLGETWRDLLMPLLLTLSSVLLIFKQPDLGTALLIFGIFIVMLFASGVGYRLFFGFLATLLLLVPFGWHFLKPYQKDRLLVFLNPNIDPLGAGYTIIQSKIAIGSGGMLGKGWLSGTQNQLNFLPERHTDFIFSVIGEEWGFLGAIIVLALYFGLIYCGLRVAYHARDVFGRLVAVGIVSILTLQVVINIGMVMGLSPVVGLTLPLMSYGRTSFLITLIMIGQLLNLSRKRSKY